MPAGRPVQYCRYCLAMRCPERSRWQYCQAVSAVLPWSAADSAARERFGATGPAKTYRRFRRPAGVQP